MPGNSSKLQQLKQTVENDQEIKIINPKLIVTLG